MSETNTPQTPTAAGAPPSAEADLSAQIDALFADFPGGGSPTPASEAATPAPAPVAAAPVVPVAPAPPSSPASEHSVPASSSMFPPPKVEAPKSAPAPVVAAAAPAPALAAAIEVEEVAPRGDALLRAVGLASIPLMKRPPIVRKAVGWIALNSIVLGGALWAWALFLRPVPEQSNTKAFDFGQGSVPAVPVKPDAAEHVEAAKKDDGKGTAKKSEPKKADAKKAESNGGGH